MRAVRVVVHTDVLMEFLLHDGRSESILRTAMAKFFCYTTVFNAIELFARARNNRQRQAIEATMSAMKILGLNPKNAVRQGKLLAHYPHVAPMDLLVAGICMESRLPLLTARRASFRGMKGLVVIPAHLVASAATGGDILRESKRLSGNGRA